MINPQKAEALRLYAMGSMSHKEVAARVGRARGTVSGWLRGAGATPGNRRPSKYLPIEVPPDTRTAAQKLMGDPIPERSALYQKMRVADDRGR